MQHQPDCAVLRKGIPSKCTCSPAKPFPLTHDMTQEEAFARAAALIAERPHMACDLIEYDHLIAWLVKRVVILERRMGPDFVAALEDKK